MTISSGSILKDPTITPSGGTAQSLNSLGGTMERKDAYFDGTQVGSRNEVSFTTKSPKVSASAPNGYTQARCNAVIKSPLALDNGNATVNTGRIEFSYDVETTAAEKATLRLYMAQLLTDSDFTEFCDGQSVE